MRRIIKRRISVVIPTYRDSERTVELVHALQKQALPSGWTLEIVVVDDGSGVPHCQQIASLKDTGAVALCLPRNVGRTQARAAGIEQAGGELLMMIDSDCQPTSQHFLATHIDALTEDHVVASTGSVLGPGNDFWSLYQNHNVLQRSNAGSPIAGTLGTTANTCVRHDAYRVVGGFDPRYTGYGFEDRDLLLRLANIGTVAWTSDAAVKHLDSLSLTDVCQKMHYAGHGNSKLFAKQHPSAYRALGYARFDARGRPALGRIGRATNKVIPSITTWLDSMLDRIPFTLARLLVKSLSAAAFLAGTSQVDDSAS